MLKKLSLRFSLAAIVTFFVVELLTVGAVIGVGFLNSLGQADETLDLLIQNDGRPLHRPEMRDGNFDLSAGEFPDGGGRRTFFEDERAVAEQKYSVRYFTARVSPSGDILMLDTGHIATISSEQAQTYALGAFSESRDRAFYNGFEFRYAVDRSSGLVVFYDFRTAVASQVTAAKLSTIIAVLLLAVFSVIILLVSKRVVSPVVRNMEKQRQFITDAGHELKTPLAIIRANTEVLEMTAGENEWTRSTVNQIDRLSDLLSQMLTLAKSSESQRVNFIDIDLSEMANSFADDFSILCNAKNKPLTANIADGAVVSGDEKMLSMMISTLLENAVKYGSAGERIDFSLSTSSRHVKISVSNLCDDPPSGDPDRLFERFYRGDSSRTRETGGSGIGLSIASSVAEAHRGRISCAVDGKRVTFSVDLPLGSSKKKS